jgi:SAM-dependent methyltransferase
MRRAHLDYFVCPLCLGHLEADDYQEGSEDNSSDRILNGRLTCAHCGATYPINQGIPRFVASDNYATGFGLEWTLHARTQYDSHSGVPISEHRFFEETGWSKDLEGELVLEVGSGSGRFTEHAANTGALIISFDYSNAVFANYSSNGWRPNVCIAQSDIYQMPFPRGTFDKLFCFGVLQHTPDVERAFMALPPMLKPGGQLVVDVYRKGLVSWALSTKYYVRPLTRNMDPARLYRVTKKWIDVMWPLARFIRRIPKIGPTLNSRLLIADHSPLGIEGPALKEFAYLDTFDMLSPRFDSPQTLRTVRRWFVEAGLSDVEIYPKGYGWIVGRGTVTSGSPL